MVNPHQKACDVWQLILKGGQKQWLSGRAYLTCSSLYLPTAGLCKAGEGRNLANDCGSPPPLAPVQRRKR